MFSVNDTVLYGTDGVCTVKEIATRSFGKTKTEYYILTPIRDPRSVIYVPTTSQTLCAKMRRILSADEIGGIIRRVAAEQDPPWIADDNLRRTQFKTVLQSGDRFEIIRMIKTIYLHGQQQKQNGKRLHHADEMILKDAEKLLYDEFAYVLSISPEDVVGFIVREIEE